MARAALDKLKLEKILFMPTGAPRYRKPAVASGEHRVAMLELALQGEPRYAIDARELKASASGYTVDTLMELHDELGTELWLLIGADQYAKLDTASEVRARIARGEAIAHLVPAAVANYIVRERLYV